MNYKIVAVGKITEKYVKQGIEEFTKRLSAYGKVEVKEIKDEPLPAKLYDKEVDRVISQEGAKILEQLSPSDYVIALDREGKHMSSKELAATLHDLAIGGKSKVVFIIGGTLGLSKGVLDRAELSLSFSKLTFPHQLMRLILLEQIYRVTKINRGEPYHY